MAAEDVYINGPDDELPGMRERSRPGAGPREKVYDKITDPSGRPISLKPPNKTMLAAQARRVDFEARKAADKAKRDAQPKSLSHISFGKILFVLLFLPLLSQFLTSTYTFGLSPHLLPLKKAWQTSQYNPFKERLRYFTPTQLAKYDGSDPWSPVYVGIDGDVYDVSKNKRVYGKGGSYNMMAGRDASRAYITGCFETHLTHDLRGLSPDELKALDNWKDFFSSHQSYKLIGKVLNPPIDPNSPIPPPCDGSASKAAAGGSAHHSRGAPGKAAADHAGAAAPQPVKKHEEL